MALVPLVWPRAGGVQQPALLPGDTDGYLYASNTAGSVIVGVSGGYPGSLASGAPVRWDSLVATELTGIASMNYSMGLNRAATLPLGANGTSINLYSQWTGGGGAGGNLSIPSGFTGTAPPAYTSGAGFPVSYLRPCSDDGLTVVGGASGGSGANPANMAIAWVSGTPTKLPSSNNPTTDSTFGGGCSEGGTIIVGSEDVGVLRNATYWTILAGVATSHPLILDATSGVQGAEGRWCDGSDVVAAARVYGIASDATTTGPAYWTSLNTSGPDPVLPGNPTAWGVIHLMTAPGGGSRDDCVLSYVSETNGVAVGNSGVSGAIKWTNTTPVILAPPGGYVSAAATSCSADGVYVGGYATDAGGKVWPVYWDGANVVHVLPTIADPTDGTQGLVVGVSRDGTTFFGAGNAPTPVSGVSINMDNVRVTSLLAESPCTSAQFSSAFAAIGPSVGLRWSDTRGKTFGNAVPQEFSDDPLWQPQWNRTGMARDRVFELFWSAAFKTAINGAFVEVTPLQS